MTRDELRAAVTRHAIRNGVSQLLAAAIVHVESGFDPFAWNPEPKFRWLWNVRTKAPFRSLDSAELASATPPGDFPMLAGDRDQEWAAQRASWGLMQVMGALARERGFRGPYLTQLVDVELNLEIGCGHLGDLVQYFGGDEDKATGAYNAGRGGWNGSLGLAYRAKVQAVLNHERE